MKRLHDIPLRRLPGGVNVFADFIRENSSFVMPGRPAPVTVVIGAEDVYRAAQNMVRDNTYTFYWDRNREGWTREVALNALRRLDANYYALRYANPRDLEGVALTVTYREYCALRDHLDPQTFRTNFGERHEGTRNMFRGVPLYIDPADPLG